jgi:hypothetical protein
MRKLSIKNVVEFRSKGPKGKKSFALSLKLDKPKPEAGNSGGGDYWVSCLSAISNAFRSNDANLIAEKRQELEDKIPETEFKITRDMYRRNIQILRNYENFDLKKWRPTKKITLLKKNRDDFTLVIKGLEIQATPQHVFLFEKKNGDEVGAIWFVAKLGGFTVEELGMFTEMLYRYLKTRFGKKYTITTRYCIAVDLFGKTDVNYLRLENGEVNSVLSETLDEIKRLL